MGKTGSKRRETGLALLLEQTAKSVYDKRAPSDIHPGQWSALRYFARANRKARTVAGLANYLGVTKGPASRAAAALVRHRLLSSHRDESDRRAPIFTVSPEGHHALKDDPIQRLAAAISNLEESHRKSLAESLTQIHAALNDEAGG